MFGLVDQGGVDAVQQPPADVAGRCPTAGRQIAMVISRPTTGSASGKPSPTPITPSTTASEVNPSVRACSPSATSAAEPIRRPTRIR